MTVDDDLLMQADERIPHLTCLDEQNDELFDAVLEKREPEKALLKEKPSKEHLRNFLKDKLAEIKTKGGKKVSSSKKFVPRKQPVLIRGSTSKS